MSVCVDDTVTYRAEMSLLMLQLSLCALTVIQLTSSIYVYDVIQQRIASQLAAMEAADIAGKYTTTTTVGRKDAAAELKKQVLYRSVHDGCCCIGTGSLSHQ